MKRQNGPRDCGLTQKHLMRRLHYNPETGVFTWKHRDDQDREQDNLSWNKRYANTRSGTISSNGGYRHICIDGIVRRASRLAWLYMTGEWPVGEVNHINGIRSDDRFANLRDVTPTQRSQNTRGKIKNRAGLKGVIERQYKHITRYQTDIRVNGKKIYLGSYDTAEEAYAAYCKAATQYFGEFARLK